MRVLLILTSALLAAAPAASADLTRNDKTLARATAGRIAGKPVDCLARLRNDDFETAGDTLIFRRSAKVTYLNRLSPGCDTSTLGSALVFRSSFGQMCRGEIVQSVDPHSGVSWGSCTVGDFVPYERP